MDIVCFGELLWDIFPDRKVAGGAPFNIVNRATALGLKATVISSVGKDELGSELIKTVESKGNNTSYIQHHPSLSTGVVQVKLSDSGEPEYDIVHPVAWDDIKVDQKVIDLVKNSQAFVYSSLGIRDERARQSLFQLLQFAPWKICDVNLREGHYEKDHVMSMLDHADVLRMNEHELDQVLQWSSISGSEREQNISELFKKSNFQKLIVTLGGEGAISYDGDKFCYQPVFKVLVADTVGSGDAFLASYIYQALKGESDQSCLEFACAVGALTASKTGGTPQIEHAEIEALIKSA